MRDGDTKLDALCALFHPSLRYYGNLPGLTLNTVFQVILRMDDGRSLGLMIRGGAEYGLGIYITGVDPGSAADVGALKVSHTLISFPKLPRFQDSLFSL